MDNSSKVYKYEELATSKNESIVQNCTSYNNSLAGIEFRGNPFRRHIGNYLYDDEWYLFVLAERMDHDLLQNKASLLFSVTMAFRIIPI